MYIFGWTKSSIYIYIYGNYLKHNVRWVWRKQEKLQKMEVKQRNRQWVDSQEDKQSIRRKQNRGRRDGWTQLSNLNQDKWITRIQRAFLLFLLVDSVYQEITFMHKSRLHTLICNCPHYCKSEHCYDQRTPAAYANTDSNCSRERGYHFQRKVATELRPFGERVLFSLSELQSFR